MAKLTLAPAENSSSLLDGEGTEGGKLFSGFSSIDLQIDEVENNDGKESSPQLYLVFESNLR